MSTKIKTFEVAFKAYYHETSDWCTDYIRAHNKGAALKTFARRHQIGKLGQPSNWRWWEGDRYMAFKFIKPVLRVPCVECRGTGVVSV